MKKSVTILSVISIIFASLSIVSAFTLLTFLWKPMSGIYTLSADIIDAGPVIPIGNILYIIGCLVVSLILLATSSSKRFIVIEIISMVFLSIIFPALTWLFGILQNTWVNPMGAISVAHLMVTNNIITFPVGIMKLSSTLCLVTSGMRIANKVYLKSRHQN